MARRPERDDFHGGAVVNRRPGLARGGWRLIQAKRLVIERDGPTCRRCGGWIDLALSGLHADGLTLGHIVPASRGGSDAPENLGPEHRRCNLAASDRRDPPKASIAIPIVRTT